jgi:acyl carrier protein
VSVGFDPLNAVRDAVAVVCDVEPDTLSGTTQFAELGADSLARVSIADLLEARAADSGARLHIDDASLCRLTTLADLADFAAQHLVKPDALRVAS